MALYSFTGNLPFYDAVALGGFLNLSGFARAQIIGESLAWQRARGEDRRQIAVICAATCGLAALRLARSMAATPETNRWLAEFGDCLCRRRDAARHGSLRLLLEQRWATIRHRYAVMKCRDWNDRLTSPAFSDGAGKASRCGVERDVALGRPPALE